MIEARASVSVSLAYMCCVSFSDCISRCAATVVVGCGVG